MKILIHQQEARNHLEWEPWFKQLGYEVEISNIVGDLAVPELSIGVERKSLSDFMSSTMSDGRIFSQADEMAIVYDQPWIVIDDNSAEWEKAKPNVYWGTIWSLRKHHLGEKGGVDVTFGNIVMWLHFFIQKETNPPKHYTDPVRYGTRKVDNSDVVMHILMALPGIGPKKAYPYRDLKLIPAIQTLKPKVKEDFRERIE